MLTTPCSYPQTYSQLHELGQEHNAKVIETTYVGQCQKRTIPTTWTGLDIG